MAIRFFDMFSGIGGFRSGLEAVGGFECVGHCEIDKFANQAYCAMYNTEGEYYCEDATKINPDEMPDFDLICAGFPCQSFSVAGKRLGFNDTRGTLFFEVARLIAAKRPAFFLLENVRGLLSHDGGKTLETIYSTLVDLDDYEFLDEFNREGHTYENEITPCIMVLGKGSDDGVCVDTSGCSYARFSAYIPHARQIVEPIITEQNTEAEEPGPVQSM